MTKHILLSALTFSMAFATASPATADDEITKKILVEEFTTELCPNCPRLASWIHSSLEKPDYADNVIVLCHHAGYYTDSFTQDFHSSYLWFYNDGGRTYAPAMMVDRRTKGGITPVKNFTSQSAMELEWAYDLGYAPKASVNISAYYDESTKKVHVKVSGTKNVKTICDEPRITVWLSEDNVPALSQAGGGTGFVHQHLSRKVSSTWGEPITLNGDDYVYECEMKVATSWKAEDLKLVASLHAYNPERPGESPIYNSEVLPWNEVEIRTSGITNMEDTEEAEAEFYTLTGLKVSAKDLTPGIYVKKEGKKSSKVLIK